MKQESVHKCLKKMQEFGQGVWVDAISLRALQSGELKRVLEARVLGVSFNSTTFQQAMTGSDLYDEQLKTGGGRARSSAAPSYQATPA